MKKYRFLNLILCLLPVVILLLFGFEYSSLLASPLEDAKVDISKSVVRIITTRQAPLYNPPWYIDTPQITSGSGSIIGNNKIITNAHLVADHTFVEVQKSQDTKKYTATVEFIGYDCDLAILSVEDSTFFVDVQALDIDDNVSVRDKVSVYGFPIGGEKISVTEGIISRIGMINYPYSGNFLLSLQVDAAINPGNSGGPAVKDNKIIGIAMSSIPSAENIGYLIPPQVINHFLTDIEDGKYDGFPNLTCDIQRMDNPGIRKLTRLSA